MRKTTLWIASAAAVLAGIAAWAALQLRPPTGPQPVATSFALPEVEIVTPLLGRRRDTLVVRDGVIAPGRPGAATRQGEAVLDSLAGAFVLPGIVDMHTHLPAETPIALTEYFGLLHVAYGVTTVRDAGDIDGTALPAAREAFERRGEIGPRIVACGPFVGGPDPRWANSIVVERPDEAAAVVARLKKDGRGCIKLYDGLDRARLQALIGAAAEAGLPAMGHVPFGLTLEDAAIPDVQHLMGVPRPDDIAAGDQVVHRVIDWHAVDEKRLQQVVDFSVRRHIAHTPTLVSTARLPMLGDPDAVRRDAAAQRMPRMYTEVVWNAASGLAQYRGFGAADIALARESLEKKLSLVRRFHEAGVALHIGTDTQQPFVVPGAATQEEMRLFARAGIPPEEVWADATWRAGEALGIARLGRLDAGAPADFLVFRRDPTADLAALDSLEAVSVGGRLYLRADLDAAIERYRDYYRRWLVDALSVWRARSVLRHAVKTSH